MSIYAGLDVSDNTTPAEADADPHTADIRDHPSDYQNIVAYGIFSCCRSATKNIL
jgi:hypothetical protein